MELYQVRAFVTVARLGHVTKAAEALCVTQPAVTQQIHSLESELNTQLFRRTTRTVELTQAGLASGPAKAVVLGGSLADLAIAIGILFRPTLARALKTGIALSLAYIVGALLLRPDLWLDPLGPMLKVLPIVALMLACLASSEER